MSQFELKGIKQAVSGHMPFWIEKRSQMYICESGIVDLFCVHRSDESKNGRRHHIMRLKEGELALGLYSESQQLDYQFMLLGVGASEINICDIEMGMEKRAEDSSREFFKQIESWVEKLHDFFLEDADCSMQFKQLDYMSAFKNQCLDDYLQKITQMVFLSIGVKRECEINRYKDRFRNDSKLYKQALLTLMNLVNVSEHNTLEEESDEDMVRVFEWIAAYMYPREPYQSLAKASIGKTEWTVETLSKRHKLRVRQITFASKWWKHDNGPLVGFINSEAATPVALLPVSSNSYEMMDPRSNVSVKVDDAVAQTLNESGFMFYKLFPNDCSNGVTLLSTGLQNGWKKDAWNLGITSVLIACVGLLFPIISGRLFDHVIPMNHRGQIWELAFILFSTVLAISLFQGVKAFAIMRLATRMTTGLQAAAWDRLMSLPTSIFKICSAGEMVERVMGVDSVRKLVSDGMLSVIIGGLFSVFTMALMFYYDWQLSFVVVGMIILTVGAVFIIGRKKIDCQRKAIQHANENNGFLIQVIDGMAKVKIAGAEKRLFFMWSKRFSEQMQWSIKSKRWSNLSETVCAALPLVASLGVFSFYLISVKNRLSIGNFVAFNAAFTVFFASVLNMVMVGINLLMTTLFYDNFKPILMEKPEFDEVKEDPGELQGEIELNHVYFKYGIDQPYVLKDVSLKIGRGEYVAIVGASGSGKSTLLRVLLGFEKVESGGVYYDNKHLEKMDIRQIRKQIGVVLQNGKLLSGTLISNIIGADPKLTVEDAWEAARGAGIANDIEMMPMGMFTVISEGTGTFSGGQKQRILISRALAKRPRMIFFDEATSALDNVTQSIVSESLKRQTATRIVIAHRLSTIMSCDKIVVMEKGAIVELGTYDELMAMRGVFYELAHRQQY